MMEDTNYAELVNELKDKREGDNICADCKNEDPRWASYNLGIFVCLRCSGIHRSLGTHISRVKSLDLDTWTYEQYKHMEDIGNVKANRYWEAKLDPDFEPPESNLEYWIRQKYDDGSFKDDGLEQPQPDFTFKEKKIENNKKDNTRNSGYSSEQAKLLTKNIFNGETGVVSEVDTSQQYTIKLKGAEMFSIGR